MKNDKKPTGMEKFTKLALKDWLFNKEVEKYTYAQLADALIQGPWSKAKFGTLNIAILDRVIEELIELDDISKISKTLLKPDKTVKVPKFDMLTEGYNPDRLQ